MLPVANIFLLTGIAIKVLVSWLSGIERPSTGNQGLLGVICLLRGLKNWFHLSDTRGEVRTGEGFSGKEPDGRQKEGKRCSDRRRQKRFIVVSSQAHI